MKLSAYISDVKQALPIVEAQEDKDADCVRLRATVCINDKTWGAFLERSGHEIRCCNMDLGYSDGFHLRGLLVKNFESVLDGEKEDP